MSMIDILIRVEVICQKYDNYDNAKQKDSNLTGDDAFVCFSATFKIEIDENLQGADTNEEDRIVIYYTSLQGIQKTYENCCVVRTIFKGFRVPVDERDVSMDSSYKKELETAALIDCGENGIDHNKKSVVMSLPQVFIRGKYVGGADKVKQLHEMGELAKLLHGFPVGASPGSVCESCGDARLVPCLNCNGSQKVFEENEGQITRCPHCNENGLIRCPICRCFRRVQSKHVPRDAHHSQSFN